MKRFRLLVLHGPNLNLLGEREPAVYGRMTLARLNARVRDFARARGCTVRVAQSNGEGELIDLLHAARGWADGIVFNPGAYTHYSYALRDAVAAIEVPTIEVHLSDIRKREKFRRVSVIAPVCRGQVSGLGWQSYTRGIELLLAAPAQGKKGKGHGR
jgi:3-dehydroquinate dehydratase-2